MTPHFLETSKCCHEEACENKLNKKGAGSTPRALPLGDESNVSLSSSVWLAPALLFLHDLFTFSSPYFLFLFGSIFWALQGINAEPSLQGRCVINAWNISRVSFVKQ